MDAGVEEEGSEGEKRGEGLTDSKQLLSSSRRPLVTPADVNHPHQIIRWPLVIRTRIRVAH